MVAEVMPILSRRCRVCGQRAPLVTGVSSSLGIRGAFRPHIRTRWLTETRYEQDLCPGSGHFAYYFRPPER